MLLFTFIVTKSILRLRGVILFVLHITQQYVKTYTLDQNSNYIKLMLQYHYQRTQIYSNYGTNLLLN